MGKKKRRYRTSQPDTRRDDQLSAREVELLDLLIDGAETSDIATSMDITYATVKFHLANAQRKLRADTRSHMAAIWATRRAVGSRAVEILARELLNADLRPTKQI